jgi:hypothetical protein
VKDYRDDTIAELADAEAALREQNADLRRDLDAYKLVTRQLLALLNLAMSEPDQWPRRAARMRDAHRQLAHEAVAAMFADEHSVRPAEAA